MLSISAFVTAGLFGESHSTSPPSAPSSSNKLSPLSLLALLSVAALRSMIIGDGWIADATEGFGEARAAVVTEISGSDDAGCGAFLPSSFNICPCRRQSYELQAGMCLRVTCRQASPTAGSSGFRLALRAPYCSIGDNSESR